MSNYRNRQKTETKSFREWVKIFLPVVAYLLLSAGLAGFLPRVMRIDSDTGAVFTTLLLFIPAILLYLFYWRSSGCASVKQQNRSQYRRIAVWLVLITALVLAPAVLTGSMAVQTADVPKSLPGFAASCIFGPVTEEILFRGQFIGRGTVKLDRTAVLFLSAFLFAAAHGSLAQFIPALTAGLLLGLLYMKSGTLVDVCIVHCAVNTIVFFKAGTIVSLPVACLTLAAEAGIGYLLYREVYRRA